MTTNVNEIKVGTKLVYSGFEATVTRVCEWDTALIEIRLERGGACVGRSEFDGRYASCYIVSI